MKAKRNEKKRREVSILDLWISRRTRIPSAKEIQTKPTRESNEENPNSTSHTHFKQCPTPELKYSKVDKERNRVEKTQRKNLPSKEKKKEKDRERNQDWESLMRASVSCLDVISKVRRGTRESSSACAPAARAHGDDRERGGCCYWHPYLLYTHTHAHTRIKRRKFEWCLVNRFSSFRRVKIKKKKKEKKKNKWRKRRKATYARPELRCEPQVSEPISSSDE